MFRPTRFINTNKTNCVLTYFTFYFIVTYTTGTPQLKIKKKEVGRVCHQSEGF